MRIVLIILLVLSGITFVWSVLLMSPKGWLGLGIGWAAGGSDYGSKKTLETKLKKVALISALLFVISAVILPYTK